MPAQPDPVVLIRASAAVPLAPSADPALNPYQPNHSRPAPSRTAGRLCGRNGSRFQPTRRPTTIARASADMPELTSTAVPPAKSNALRSLAIQPPETPSPSNAKTQCAIGTYTSVSQTGTNRAQAMN